MKNILILVPSIGIGGREKIAINTYSCLKDKYNVSFVIFQRAEEEYKTDFDIINFDLPTLKNKFSKVLQQLKRTAKLVSFCHKNRIDCVFSLGETANLTNILAQKFCSYKSVTAVHGFAEVYRSRQTAFVFENSHKVVCISQDMEYELLKLFPHIDTTVIENGYETDLQLKGRTNISHFSEDCPKLVSMGRLEHVKGFDRLLSAFSKVVKEIPNAGLSIIGMGSYEEILKNTAKELNIENSVRFLGFMSDPFEELVKNDIYVLSSRNEGFPNCLIEALASGLAVVSADCKSGPREILSEKYTNENIVGIKEEKYGILTENSENEEILVYLLSEAIINLIKDSEKVNYYKNIGSERSRDFSLDIYKKKIESLFDNLGIQ